MEEQNIKINIKVEGNKTNKMVDSIFIIDGKEKTKYCIENRGPIITTKEELKKYPTLYEIFRNNFGDEYEKRTLIIYSSDLDHFIERETEGMNQQQTEKKIKEIIQELEREIKEIEGEAGEININKTFEIEI